MAAKSRQSILKRQRELKRLEKAGLKREKREERRRKAAEAKEAGDTEDISPEDAMENEPETADGPEES